MLAIGGDVRRSGVILDRSFMKGMKPTHPFDVAWLVYDRLAPSLVYWGANKFLI